MPDVILPRLADTLEEGTVSRWLKRPGERVARGEPLVEIETDKVNSELESPYEGVVTEIVAPEGATVPVGDVLARIDSGEWAEAPEVDTGTAPPANRAGTGPPGVQALSYRPATDRRADAGGEGAALPSPSSRS